MSFAPRSSSRRPVELAHATLEKFRRGDAQSFAQIVRAYTPLVRGAVARYWKGAFDREEAMQEIWMHVFRSREALDVERAESFSGWLAVLARRKCIDLLRHPADPALAGEVDPDEAFAWLSTPPEQDATLQNEEIARAVDTFKAKLKPVWRDFFQLHFVDGLDYEAISERLSIGKLRCKYMRKVLATRAAKNPQILAAFGKSPKPGGADAS